MNERVVVAPITRVTGGRATTDQDLVAAESPLEIVLRHAPVSSPDEAPRSLGLTMRTPGDDEDLVLGLLVSEQLITGMSDVMSLTFAAGIDASGPDDTGQPARVTVEVAPTVDLTGWDRTRALDRSSACGLCGRLAMQAVRLAGGRRAPDAPRIDAAVIAGMPDRLRRQQAVFAETGGLHAAALCDAAGEPFLLREDVGRHNAVDKVIGAALRASRFPAVEAWLAVSGRVAFEIVQKACAAGVIGIVAVGAPSGLAVDAARAAGLTLVGFARDGRFNIYCGRERIVTPGENSPG